MKSFKHEWLVDENAPTEIHFSEFVKGPSMTFASVPRTGEVIFHPSGEVVVRCWGSSTPREFVFFRPWRERWFTRPWRPFQKHRIEVPDLMPDEPVVVIGSASSE